MDFRELNLGAQLDEEGFSNKRAVFEDSDDEQEDYELNNAATTQRNSFIPENDNLSGGIMSDDIGFMKRESVMIEISKQSEGQNDSIEYTPDKSTEIINDPEEFNIDDIEGIPYSREGGRPIHHKENKEPLYGITTVAKLLGLSTQAVRNYCDYFEDYLQIQKKESGHRIFTYDDIERIRQLLKTKDEKNLTLEQLKEYLQGPEQFEVVPESQRFETAIERMEQAFELSLKSAISYVIESNSKLLEQKDEETYKMLNGVSEQLKSQDAAINELIEIIKDKKETSDTILSKTIEQLQNSLKDRDQRIEDLIKVSEQQNAKITEYETKKQKKFFGLF